MWVFAAGVITGIGLYPALLYSGAPPVDVFLGSFAAHALLLLVWKVSGWVRKRNDSGTN
jgi:hypothetical protein